MFPALMLGLTVVLSVGVVVGYSLLRDGGAPPQQQTIAKPPVQNAPQSSTAGEDYVAGTEEEQAQSGAVSSQQSTPQEENSESAAPAISQNDWRTVLVNSKNKLDGDYNVKLGAIGNYQLDERILADTQAMIDAAKADGYTIQIYSAYRPMERSRVLYTGKVNEYMNAGYTREAAEKEAARWIAPPGTSEHNTGLSADIISGDYFTKFPDLVHEFETTAEFKWLYEHCAEYGFILRYPKDKQEITGITYEPWHYRYVGREVAKEIMEKKICLEEYLGQA